MLSIEHWDGGELTCINCGYTPTPKPLPFVNHMGTQLTTSEAYDMEKIRRRRPPRRLKS